MQARNLLTRRFLITVTTRRPPEGARLRPVPVVLVETDTPSQLSEKWQERLGKFAFKSAVASLRRQQDGNDSNNGDGKKLLDTWYQELRGESESLRDFPPIMVAHGLAAWRVCQKYVANQPVTGLVLAAGPSNASIAAAMPKTDFEPYFPLAVVAKEAVEESSEDIEHLTVEDDENHEEIMNKAVSWIEECF